MVAGDGGQHFKISPHEALLYTALDRPERRHPENKEEQEKRNTLSLSQEVSWVSCLVEPLGDMERTPEAVFLLLLLPSHLFLDAVGKVVQTPAVWSGKSP